MHCSRRFIKIVNLDEKHLLSLFCFNLFAWQRETGNLGIVSEHLVCYKHISPHCISAHFTLSISAHFNLCISAIFIDFGYFPTQLGCFFNISPRCNNNRRVWAIQCNATSKRALDIEHIYTLCIEVYLHSWFIAMYLQNIVTRAQ